MLLQSIVKRTLGLKRHYDQSIKEEEGELHIFLTARKNWRLPCGQCGTLGRVRARLGHLENLNLRTNRAYLLKEGFREFWTYWSKGWAKKFLAKWFWWATHSRLKPMRDFAWMLRRHQEGLLNYFELRIDNGTVEGLNNNAKVISHRCYGFRTAKTYILVLYQGLGNLPEPKLVHKFL